MSTFAFKMKARLLLEVPLYVALLAGALTSCWQNVRDYLEYSTDYSLVQEPISMEDLPTLTFCWQVGDTSYGTLEELAYGKDFIVKARVLETVDTANTSLKGTKCEFRSICIPYSLPFSKDQITVCKNDTDKACFEGILENLKSDQKIHCKKTSHVKEFKVQRRRLSRDTSDDPQQTFVVEYRHT